MFRKYSKLLGFQKVLLQWSFMYWLFPETYKFRERISQMKRNSAQTQIQDFQVRDANSKDGGRQPIIWPPHPQLHDYERNWTETGRVSGDLPLGSAIALLTSSKMDALSELSDFYRLQTKVQEGNVSHM